MKNLFKLIRRFVGMLLLSSPLILLLNLLLLGLLTSRQAPNADPWTMAQQAAEALQLSPEGCSLPEPLEQSLENEGIWAVYIDNHTLRAAWQTKNLPDCIPASYTAADIARLTRGYMEDYPTFTGVGQSGLMVLGYPKQSYWKNLWPSWDYQLIAGLPALLLLFVLMNLLMLVLIYLMAISKLLKSIQPITDGIQDLGACRPVYIRQEGPLSEIALHINRASERLQFQNFQLRRRETARVNWIAGVSHDIRTPLSMVMGYAAQLQKDVRLPQEARGRAEVILKQSERMKNLIGDLNLASRLEYNMQPIEKRPENMLMLVRQAAVDFINLQQEERYPVQWEEERPPAGCTVCADGRLIQRAVTNLLQNCVNHNEQGCTIYLSLLEEGGNCIVSVEDDGAGVSDSQLKRLKGPLQDGSGGAFWQQHGLGLSIVRQIAASHGGRLELFRSAHGGFAARLILPVKKGSE